MIVNLIAIDPADDSRILQYRIPENSHELRLLEALFAREAIDYTILVSDKVKAMHARALIHKESAK